MIEDVEHLKMFHGLGYEFEEGFSNENQLTFIKKRNIKEEL